MKITTTQYLKIMQHLTENKDVETEKLFDLVGIDIRDLTIKEIEEKSKYLSELLMNKPIIDYRFLVYKGKLYGFEPKLDSLSFGQLIDLESLKIDIWNNMSNILKVFYRPVNKLSFWNKVKVLSYFKYGKKLPTKLNYSIEKYTGQEENFDLDLIPIELIQSFTFFFSIFYLELQKNILQSSLEEKVKEMGV